MRFIFMVTTAFVFAVGCAKDKPDHAAPAPVRSNAAASALEGCVRAVCPFANEDLGRPRPPGHDARVESDLRDVIQPLVQEQIAMAEGSRVFRDLIDAFPGVSFDDVTLNDDVRVLLNLFHVLDALALLESRGMVEQNLKNAQNGFDVEAALALWRRTPAFVDADQNLAKAAGLLANSLGYRLIDLRENIPISWFYHQAGPKLTYRAFIRDTFEQIKRAEAIVNRAFPYLERPKSELMRRYEAKQVISDQDSPALLNELATYGTMADALTEPDQRAALLAVKRDYVAEANRVRLNIRVRNLEDRAWPRPVVESFCMARYREKLGTFPTREEILAYDRTERVPTQAIAVAALRELGLDEGAKRLLTAAVHYPVPYDRAVKQLANDLVTETAFHRAQGARLARLRDQLRQNDPQARAELLALFVGHGVDDPQEINAVYGACDQIRPTPSRDATFDTEIAVSWQILLRQLSSRTLAHEMGHAAFFAYGEDQRPPVMRDQIACLQRRHQGLEANPAHYVIEDYADLIGNEVTRRAGDRRPFSLCEDFSAEFATVAQPPGSRDPHSATLFRLLVIMGQDPPPRCEPVVRAAGATNLGERCWLPSASASSP